MKIVFALVICLAFGVLFLPVLLASFSENSFVKRFFSWFERSDAENTEMLKKLENDAQNLTDEELLELKNYYSSQVIVLPASYIEFGRAPLPVFQGTLASKYFSLVKAEIERRKNNN
ncbi:MAG: hypothetical protein ACK5N8_02000 [Alphaproteobacteria bacterium]